MFRNKIPEKKWIFQSEPNWLLFETDRDWSNKKDSVACVRACVSRFDHLTVSPTYLDCLPAGIGKFPCLYVFVSLSVRYFVSMLSVTHGHNQIERCARQTSSELRLNPSTIPFNPRKKKHLFHCTRMNDWMNELTWASIQRYIDSRTSPASCVPTAILFVHFKTKFGISLSFSLYIFYLT